MAKGAQCLSTLPVGNFPILWWYERWRRHNPRRHIFHTPGPGHARV